MTNINLYYKKTIILFAGYKKAFTFAPNKTIEQKKNNVMLISRINLSVLHIIRVVVENPRGVEGSCM